MTGPRAVPAGRVGVLVTAGLLQPVPAGPVPAGVRHVFSVLQQLFVTVLFTLGQLCVSVEFPLVMVLASGVFPLGQLLVSVQFPLGQLQVGAVSPGTGDTGCSLRVTGLAGALPASQPCWEPQHGPAPHGRSHQSMEIQGFIPAESICHEEEKECPSKIKTCLNLQDFVGGTWIHPI